MERLPLKERITLSDLREERAREMLEEAKKTFEIGMFKTSVNRSYYAVLHATRSLLILKGFDPVTHEGTFKLFALDFVRTGLISKELLKIQKRLLSLRRDVDYGDMVTIEEEDAKRALEEAEMFLKEILPLRKSMIEEMKD